MKLLKCDMCGSRDLVKKDDIFICSYCESRYSDESAKIIDRKYAEKDQKQELPEKTIEDIAEKDRKKETPDYVFLSRLSEEKLTAARHLYYKKSGNIKYILALYKDILDLYKNAQANGVYYSLDFVEMREFVVYVFTRREELELVDTFLRDYNILIDLMKDYEAIIELSIKNANAEDKEQLESEKKKNLDFFDNIINKVFEKEEKRRPKLSFPSSSPRPGLEDAVTPWFVICGLIFIFFLVYLLYS